MNTGDPTTLYDKYLQARIAALEAENAKLRRQVEFVKRRHHDNDGEGWCGVCGYRGQDQQYGHEKDCPHAEASK